MDRCPRVDSQSIGRSQARQVRAVGRLYTREPVICNVAIALVVMVTNHLAFDYSAEVKALIDIIMAGATGVSRQLVSPYYASTRGDDDRGSHGDNGDDGPEDGQELPII